MQITGKRMGHSPRVARVLFVALFCWIFLENSIGSFVYKNFSGEVGQLVPLLKYMIFAVSSSVFILLLMSGRQKLISTDLYVFGYLLFVLSIVALMLYSGGQVGGYLYLYVVPPLIYLTGRAFGGFDYQYILSCVKYGVMVSITFGVVDLYFFGESYWKDFLDYGGYIAGVKGFEETIVDGLPGNFYYSPYVLKIKRLVSLMGDPLAYGYFCFIAYCVVTYNVYGEPVNRWLSFIIVLAIVLTLTRAAMISLLIVFLLNRFSRKYGVVYVVIFAFFVVFSLVVVGVDLSDLSDSSTIGHVASLYSVVEYVTPFRMVFGALDDGGFRYFEPGLANILINFGLLPFVFFLAIVFSIYNRALRTHPEVSYIFAGGIFTLIIFSQSFLSTSASWLAWFLAGNVVARNVVTSKDDLVS